jgi:glycosyltransferase involved in cell wall biosynthesis
MRYSIITPTLVRPTLRRLADSIFSQTDTSWEWLIAVDVPLVVFPEKKQLIEELAKDPRVHVHRCGVQHRNYGNTCRNQAHDRAKGDYLYFIDDDDYLADAEALRTLQQVTADWAIFPIMRCGHLWFCEPPGMGRTGSGMFIYKRALGVRYPDVPDYSADGTLAEQLLKYPYQALRDERPLMIYEQRGVGKE